MGGDEEGEGRRVGGNGGRKKEKEGEREEGRVRGRKGG